MSRSLGSVVSLGGLLLIVGLTQAPLAHAISFFAKQNAQPEPRAYSEYGAGGNQDLQDPEAGEAQPAESDAGESFDSWQKDQMNEEAMDGEEQEGTSPPPV